MSYQNIHYQREKNLMHVWDDTRGYRAIPYTRYAYQRDPNGEFESLYGDKLTKVFKFSKDDPDLFESDVPETTRFLVDTYTDNDIESNGHIILTYDIEIEMESGLPDVLKAGNEMTAIGLHDSATNHYWVLIMDKSGNLKQIETENRTVLPFRDEAQMCMAYLDIYEHINPTIVTGWNIDDFDTPYLYNRIKRLLGEKQANRLSPIGEVFWSPYRKRYFIGGVSYLDYIHLYKTYTYSELANYRLDSIAMLELGRGKLEYNGNLDKLFRTDVNKFIEYNITDVELVVSLDAKLQFIDLCKGICHAGHVPYEDFIYSSKYLEGAMLCYLKRRNIVAPNKPSDRQERMQALRDNEQEKFIGAYVKAPIVGRYEWIYDLDLTSLYPSIIMGTNISPETKVAKVINWDSSKYLKGEIDMFELSDSSTISKENFKTMLAEEKYAISSNGVLYRTDKVGCIPAILDLWFNQRVEYRKLEKQYGQAGDKEKHAFYKKRQHVQKILLNSLYGVLGLPAFRFYDVDNAEAVTLSGQTVIKSTADMANLKYNKELGTNGADYNIYIDTDSIFFSALPILDFRYTDWREKDPIEIAKLVDGVAGEMQDYLNEFYDILAERVFNISRDKHRLQIKKEFVSRSGIWLAKKRYAMWIVAENGLPVDKLDVKGLDVVRSSYPAEFRKFMSEVLIDILNGKSESELSDKVYYFKQALPEVKAVSIAKNSAVKELSKYIPKGKQTAMFRFNSGTPAHVKAAIAHNQLLIHYGCSSAYEPMRDGDKVKWMYLKQNPFGLNAIAFKGWEDPDEIMDFIKIYADYDEVFERELLGKLQDFYTALNWRSPLGSTKVSEEFFQF